MRLIGALFLLTIIISCREKRNSEIADAQCVIIKPISNHIMIGLPYRVEIIFSCYKPDSLNQIKVNANFDGELYLDSGRVYWSGPPEQEGANNFKGEIEVATKDGVKKFPFDESFVSGRVDVVCNNSIFHYLIRGKENIVRIISPGFFANEINVSAIGGQIKPTGKDSDYIITPDSSDKVVVNVSFKLDNKIVSIGNYSFDVIDNLSQIKNQNN